MRIKTFRKPAFLPVDDPRINEMLISKGGGYDRKKGALDKATFPQWPWHPMSSQRLAKERRGRGVSGVINVYVVFFLPPPSPIVVHPFILLFVFWPSLSCVLSIAHGM